MFSRISVLFITFNLIVAAPRLCNSMSIGMSIGIDDSIDGAPYPIVLLHGITSDNTELTTVANWLMETLPNKVYNLDIGNGKLDSIFKTMDWQLNQLCYEIYSIPELENGFHFIGMSQGGLLARGYVERCNKFPVINLITWVTPHAGVFGINDIQFNFDNVYKPFYQNIYSFSGYWKDPFRYNMYLSSASYLPYLNNEINTTYQNNFIEGGGFNKGFYEDTYKNIELSQEQNTKNMLSLKNFIMIWSPNDDVISPPESGKFGFYDIISDRNKYSLMEQLDILADFVINDAELPVKDFFESDQYTKDLLGLRTLYDAGRLHILETNCTHSGHKTEQCFPQLEKLTFPFLV
jgi:palmitoyl-protein thioesterase